MEIHLLVLEGKHKGVKIRLPRIQFVIGRDEKCHLRPASTDVSRYHCAIARMGHRVLVRDLNSANGTLVNGEKVSGTITVHDGDRLEVGPLKFRFEFKIDAVQATEESDSSLRWLLRSPDTDEVQALDPSKDTAIISVSLFEQAEEGRTGEKQDSRATAVAGEYLQEYLHRKKTSK